MISQQSWSDAQALWDFQLMGHEPRPCSVLIGLGSHDLGVADATADLYQRGMAPLIVFTGATSRTTEGRMPRGEAEHYRDRALELGVPAEAIHVEVEARNTGQNIQFCRALLESEGIDVKSAILVSKPYEERRANATARKVWPEVEWLSASAPVALHEYVDSIGDAGLVIDMLVGAQQRLEVYPRQGFMEAEEIPESIASSCQRLRSAGFTSRLLNRN